MFQKSHVSTVTIIPVRPAADPAPGAESGDGGLPRRPLARGGYSRRTFGRTEASRRTFGRYLPSRRTF